MKKTSLTTSEQRKVTANNKKRKKELQMAGRTEI